MHILTWYVEQRDDSWEKPAEIWHKCYCAGIVSLNSKKKPFCCSVLVVWMTADRWQMETKYRSLVYVIVELLYWIMGLCAVMGIFLCTILTFTQL